MQKIQHLWVSCALVCGLGVPLCVQATTVNEYISQHSLSKERVKACYQKNSLNKDATLTKIQSKKLLACLSNNIEIITVHGRQWLPQEVEVSGQYVLSRDFLDNTVIGNGNITDMLTILPGIQGAEDASNVNNQAEIKSKLISISGGRPSDTGFFIDGQSNNSELDPDASSLSVNAINDVQGHPQQVFVNQAVVAQVKVFDSNIPVEYGGFSGGVVDIELRDQSQSPKFQFDYRVSNSALNKYKLIDNIVLNQSDKDNAAGVGPIKPKFNKENINLLASQQLTKDQSVSLSVSHTSSEMTTISLLKPVVTSRESTNATLAYTVKDIGIDKLSMRLTYSPYQGQYIRKDVVKSNFTIKGGGVFGSLAANHSWDVLDYSASFRYGVSQNSRRAPHAYYPWARAKGKNWGVDSGGLPKSKEGGYGDINKQQTSLSLRQSFNFNSFYFAGIEHQFSAGINYSQSTLQRQRETTAIIYSSPFRDSDIDCNGVSSDCIEQSYHLSLAELAEQLGGKIQLDNPKHFNAYQDNVLSRGQYFQLRKIYPIEDINIKTNKLSAYTQNSFELGSLNVRSGLRFDHNDFLERWNVSPRFHFGYDLFDDNETMLIMGVSRYYSSNMLTYKLREAKRDYVTQYRSIYHGQVQPWQVSLDAPSYRYVFENLTTPYSDELSLGIKQSLLGGVISLSKVSRDSKDLLARGDSYVKDGITYINQNNSGESTHDRWSLAYNIALGRHQLMFNVSKTDNTSNSDNSEQSIEHVPDDELVVVAIGYGDDEKLTLLSQDSLTIRSSNFSRPITANASLSSQWSHSIRTSLVASYIGAYDSMSNTGEERALKRGDIVCPGCGVTGVEYQVFRQLNRPAVVMLNAKLAYQYHFDSKQQLNFTVEFQNLLNARTHAVGINQIGLETGRSVWLGISYRFH
jgi:hypothetical protein